MKKLKNNTGSTKTWNGQEIQPGSYYTLQETEYDVWISDTDVESAITAGDAIFNDGIQDFTDPAEGLDLFKSVNANCIRDVIVDDTNKADGKTLVYKSTSGKIEYDDPSIIFGSQFEKSSSLPESITTAITYEQKLRHTTQSLPNGTYRIYCKLSIGNGQTKKDVKCRAQINDSITISENTSDQTYTNQSFLYYYTGSGVLNIDIDYCSITIQSSAYCKNAYIEIWRVS